MTARQRRTASAFFLLGAVVAAAARAGAHSGPPYPLVSDRIAGAYRISVWTDPDATRDGTSGGQFWVMLDPIDAGRRVTDDTEVRVSIEPRDRPGAARSGAATAENGNAARRFAALRMDHEGLFGVRVLVRGPLGTAEVNSEVQATYDLRPPPLMLALYLMPFLAVGGLWLKMLLRRRRTAADTVH